jgi:hypothetical protein
MEKIITAIEENIFNVSGYFLQQTEQLLSQHPAPGMWSKKEIIGHLCDSAFNNIQRFIRAQYEENPVIQYEQDNWVKISAYNSYRKEELITLWQSLNKHLCKILANMPPENYDRVCTMMAFGNETKSYSLRWVAEDYLRHMDHHLKKVIGDD